MPISPTPWTRDQYGAIRDAAGERVALNHVSFATGRISDPEADSNTALLLAAPALLEFWRAYTGPAKWGDADRELDAAFMAADAAVRALEE